jgi:hypothetical protein
MDAMVTTMPNVVKGDMLSCLYAHPLLATSHSSFIALAGIGLGVVEISLALTNN